MMTLKRLNQPKIYNSAGKEVVLTSQERYHAEHVQRQFNEAHIRFARHNNALGYEVSITTLTTIMKKITEQKYFQVAPADYFPVRVGQGAWSSQLTTYRSFQLGGQFEEGIINLGGQNSRLATVNAGVDALTIQVQNWAKSLGWTIFELEQAARSGNWDLVTALEKARKENWDLGIQKVAFLGAQGMNASGGSCLGLLNQPGITNNTTIITEAISNMDPAELKAFVVAVVNEYRENNQRTAFPNRFIVPESDFLGMVGMSSPEFPIKSIKELLEEAFRTICGSEFKILPLAYADASYHSEVSSIAGKQIYTLLRYDEESVRMDIPVDYTNTLANSVDNFSFQNAGYGQFTGVLAYRPREMLYFTYTAA